MISDGDAGFPTVMAANNLACRTEWELHDIENASMNVIRLSENETLPVVGVKDPI
jgi:hypothetical protein